MEIKYPILPAFTQYQPGYYYSKSKAKYVKIDEIHLAHLNNVIAAVEAQVEKFRKTVYEYNVGLGTADPKELQQHIGLMHISELALGLHPQYAELTTAKINKEKQLNHQITTKPLL
jgi:hypothetical protein